MSDKTQKVESSDGSSDKKSKKKKKDGAQKGTAKIKRFKEPRNRVPKKTKNGLTLDYRKLLLRTQDGRVLSRIEPIKPIDVVVDEEGNTVKKPRHRRHHYGASSNLVHKALLAGDIEKSGKNQLGFTVFKLTPTGVQKIQGM